MPSRTRAVRRVALWVPLREHYAREAFMGVVSQARRLGWFFRLVSTLSEEVLRQFRPDGVIGFLHQEPANGVFEALGVPVVNVSAADPPAGIPLVCVDNRQCGRLAAEHLLATRMPRFVFIAAVETHYARERALGFEERLAEAGYPCERAGFTLPEAVAADTPTFPKLMDVLRRLSRPVGILAAHDLNGVSVVMAARELGLAVPEDVAVVGVDNDPIVCEASDPPLSSVAVPGMQVGVRAAQLLQSMMDGAPAPAAPLLLAPIAVHARQSSNALAVGDRRVAAAVAFARDHLGAGVRVAQLARHVGLNRRTLELLFADHLGRSPAAEIQRLRIENVKDLLAENDWPMSEIAAAAGFSSQARMSTAFRRTTGMTPRAYRKQRREGRLMNS